MNKECDMNFIIMIIFVLLLNSCVGNQKNNNNQTNKDNLTNDIKRDKTPSTPRVNIPTHTF